jgi:hypothetical protein
MLRTTPTPSAGLSDEIFTAGTLARRLLKETLMRTTNLTTTAVLGTVFVIGCAPIGQPYHGGGDDPGVDGGTQESVCNDLVTKTMDLTLSGSSSSYTNLPTGCWKLDGKLTVSGSVASLADLGDLRGVADLVIDSAPLARIDTKSPLQVTRSIDIRNTTKLTDLANLAIPDDVTCLSYLASVSIVANSALTSLGGLGQLRCVSGSVTIQNNVNLTSIALDHARRLEGGLTIQDNTALTQLSLAALESVSQDLVIRHNVALTSVAAMPALQYLHGSVIIDNNTALTTLPSAMGTTPPVVEGALAITANPKLTNLGQFAHLSGVNTTISVSNNGQLDFCAAREVGCCVPHNGNALIQNNKNSSCNGPHSWCYDAQGGACYGYTN